MTTQDVLEDYRARSWRFLADLQSRSEMEFVVGNRQGQYLWNLEGDRQILDCGNGGGVHSLGHRNAEVVATLQDAVAALDAGMWAMPSPDSLACGRSLGGGVSNSRHLPQRRHIKFLNLDRPGNHVLLSRDRAQQCAGISARLPRLERISGHCDRLRCGRLVRSLPSAKRSQRFFRHLRAISLRSTHC